MGLICSRLGNVDLRAMGATPFNNARQGPVSQWQTWNNEFLSYPVGLNAQYARFMAMEYGGIACDMVGINDISAGMAKFCDMTATLTGSNAVSVSAGGMTRLRDMVCDIAGTNTMSAGMLKYVDMACRMVVNALTAGDVEGATLDATIVGDTSLREAIQVILAHAQSTEAPTVEPPTVGITPPSDVPPILGG